MPESATTASVCPKWNAVQEAVQLIHQGKGTLDTLGQLIRLLFDLGVGGLAEPFVAGVNLSNPQWHAEREGILQAVRKLPGGRLTWESRSQIFSENIEAFAAENPTIAGLPDFWRQHQERYSLYLANDGNFQVVDQQAPSIFAGLVGGLIDHRALTRFWTYSGKGYGMPRPVLFDGAGYGWVLNRALETTHRSFHDYSCAIYLLEPDPTAACILLNLHDLRPWRGRIRFFIGPDAKERFTRSLLDKPHWALPFNQISELILQRAGLDLRDPVNSVAERRRINDQALEEEAESYYGKFTLKDWASRFEAAANGQRSLKVLGITTRFSTVLQYTMEELGQAIRAAGHEFMVCKEADDQSHDVLDRPAVVGFKPDLIVLISRLRSENPSIPRQVPFLCWDQDNLPTMRTDAARKGLDAMTYIAGHAALQGYQDLGWPRRNCIFTLLAGATHRYPNTPVSQALLNRHRCTFSYTSNASETPEKALKDYSASYSGDRLILFECVAKEILARVKTGYVWDTARIMDLLNARTPGNQQPQSPEEREQMLSHLRVVSDRAFRHVALGWVADYCRRNNRTLRLYGKGWESHPRFAEFAAGFLAPGEEMRAVYQASDINLQIIGSGFVHSRVLDGLAAGGFFLYRLANETRDLDHSEQARLIMTRRALETGCVTFGQLDASRDPLITGAWAHARNRIAPGKPDEYCRMLDIWQALPSEEFQIPGLDQITFDSQERFNAMTDQYLANPDLRRGVARQFRRLVIDHYSYDARWKQFLSAITAGLRDAANATADATPTRPAQTEALAA